jgi:hypothetical protein
MKMTVRANTDANSFATNVIEFNRISGCSLNFWTIVGKISQKLTEVESRVIDSVDSQEITE